MGIIGKLKTGLQLRLHEKQRSVLINAINALPSTERGITLVDIGAAGDIDRGGKRLPLSSIILGSSRTRDPARR